MCGRFSLFTPPAQLARLFDAELAGDVDPGEPPRWNIAPTTEILGLRFGGQGPGGGPGPGSGVGEPVRLPLLLDHFRWGLVPSGAKDAASASRLFNARAETVASRPSFRASFESRRMAVLADGFLEWRKGGGKGRQPHYFHRADGEPMAFAGLWSEWRDPRPEAIERPPLRSCTIITTAAGQDMDGIHDRMPVLLARDTLDVWLDPDPGDRAELTGLLRPLPIGTLVHHEVDQRVGNVRNDDPEVIAPVQRAASLF